MTEIVPVISVDEEIVALARRYRAANSVGMQVLNLVGGQAENLLERLPDVAKDRLEGATERALEAALQAAARSRTVVPDQKSWLNTAMATAMGAAGGAGGLPTALAELPVTVTVLMRAMLGVAAEHGYDPGDPAVAQECLSIFASAGPLASDDGAEMGFLAARVTLTGPSVHALIAKLAPKASVVLGQKLAAQTVPLLGAAAGAAVNYAYTSYYQDMARVQFGLIRLSDRSGEAREALVAALRRELKSPPIKRM